MSDEKKGDNEKEKKMTVEERKKGLQERLDKLIKKGKNVTHLELKLKNCTTDNCCDEVEKEIEILEKQITKKPGHVHKPPIKKNSKGKKPGGR